MLIDSQQFRNSLSCLDFLLVFWQQTCMKRSKSSSRCCPNPDCSFKGQSGKGNIIRHSFYITSQGRRRRYRCKQCGRTFSSTHGTPYYRLHKPRSLFDAVVHMCVHGLAISAMARIKRMAWGTVACWLESAAAYAARLSWLFLLWSYLPRWQREVTRPLLLCSPRMGLLLSSLRGFRARCPRVLTRSPDQVIMNL